MLRTPKSYSLYPYLGQLAPRSCQALQAVGRLWPSDDDDNGDDYDNGDDEDEDGDDSNNDYGDNDNDDEDENDDDDIQTNLWIVVVGAGLASPLP